MTTDYYGQKYRIKLVTGSKIAVSLERWSPAGYWYNLGTFGDVSNARAHMEKDKRIEKDLEDQKKRIVEELGPTGVLYFE